MSNLKIGQTRNYLRQMAKARKLGLIVPNDHTLTIDIDNPTIDGYFRWDVANALIKNNWVMHDTHLITSSASGNRHVYLWLINPQPVAVRIAMQAALGSDAIRELLSSMDMECEVPIAMFEKPDEYFNVMQWIEERECNNGPI